MRFFNKTLLYAPLLFRGSGKGIWPPTCPDAWYAKWQLELYDWFSKRKGLDVIWKAPPRTSSFESPVKGLKAKNVRYSERRLGRELRRSDLVFVDYPSTPMWDAMRLGLSTLCITFWDINFIRNELFDSLNMFYIEREHYVLAFDRLEKFVGDIVPVRKCLTLNFTDWIRRVLENERVA